MKIRKNNKYLILFLTILFAVCVLSTLSLSYTNAFAIENIVLSIDTFGFGRSELPDGYAGKSYPVFPYKASDGSGRELTDKQVLVFDPSNTILPIKNGRFDTETEGIYTIEYLAKKGHEIKTEELHINVLSEEEYTTPSYIISDEIVGSTNTGSAVFLPNGKLEGDNVTLSLDVEYKSGSYPYNPVVETGVDTVYFVPETEGTYSVVYTLTDFVGGFVKTETEITVIDSDLPILRIPSVSKVAQVGVTSQYPVAEAVLYREGRKIYVPVKISIGERDITQTMSYVPDEVGEYIVKYSAANVYDTDKVAVSEHAVTVYGGIDPDLAYATRFFSFNNMLMDYRSESDTLESYVTTLSALSAGDKSSFDFKTPIRQELLSVSMGTDGEENRFNAIHIYFYDSKYYDESLCVTLIENENKKVDVLLNGKKVTEWNKTFTGVISEYEQSAFTVRYDAVSKTLVDENDELIAKPSSYANGKVFHGFTSRSAYLSVVLEGVTANSRVKLYRIAGQTISDAPVDTLDPILIFGEKFVRTQNADLGQKVTVGYVDVYDLFDVSPKLSMTVTAPSGVKIYSGDAYNYTFVPQEYGVYAINYVAKDTSGREKTMRAIVQVIDRIAPNIKLNARLDRVVKKNSEYTLSTANVSDNYSTEITSWISVSFENSAEEFINNGKYIFRKAGVYTITYGAMDAAGNKTLVSYQVKCE